MPNISPKILASEEKAPPPIGQSVLETNVLIGHGVLMMQKR